MPDADLIRCHSCGADNRVPRDKIDKGLTAVCGRCKTPLPHAAKPHAVKPMTVTDASFPADVERSPLPVLVDAWAGWCMPCRTIAPVIEELAAEMAGRVRVAKLNVDENPATASRFDLRSIPTLLIFKDGQEIDRLVGVQPKSEIMRRLAQVTSR
jgi:thioredoxin 2